MLGISRHLGARATFHPNIALGPKAKGRGVMLFYPPKRLTFTAVFVPSVPISPRSSRLSHREVEAIRDYSRNRHKVLQRHPRHHSAPSSPD